jgi:DNA-directed RNA polymerase specialized sigma54-like protein
VLLSAYLIILPGILRTAHVAHEDALKSRIVQLNERIRLLELALAELQALVSDEPHPLLDLQPQDVKDTADKEFFNLTEPNTSDVDSSQTLSEEDNFVDAFGKSFICQT